ncbi:ankyrin repeat domain-containing protein [Rosistilla oblonga]|uniref:ankyrin repeat domain-containing protein n=1 Tax=Rosistilla oblonga TaxID=2527990 RepID=UPI003A98216E
MNSNRPPLHDSVDQAVHKAAADAPEELQRLLNADPNLRDEPGWFWRTPLHVAAETGNARSVDILLRAGADPNAEEGLHHDTPLINAVVSDSESCIRLLIDAGADPKKPGRRRQPPIFMTRSRSAIQSLLDAGADLDAKDENGDVPFQNCASYIGSIEVLQFWLDRGVDPNLQPVVGWPSLHGIVCGGIPERFVSEGQRVEILRLLLDSGALIDLRDKTGVTALHYACQSHLHLSKCADLLLRRGADPNLYDSWGNTPLVFAVTRGYTDIAQLLLDNGADPNLPNHHHCHPLDLCANVEPETTRRSLQELLSPVTQKSERPLPKPKEVLDRLLAIPKYQNQTRTKCSKAEIDSLEESLQVKFPRSYRRFLAELGRGLDDFMISDHWRFRVDEVLEISRNDEYRDFCDLPKEYFVFAERNGCWWAYFVLDGNDDPPVFGFDDGEQRSHRFVSRSVWEFVESLVIDYEHWCGKEGD